MKNTESKRKTTKCYFCKKVKLCFESLVYDKKELKDVYSCLSCYKRITK